MSFELGCELPWSPSPSIMTYMHHAHPLARRPGGVRTAVAARRRRQALLWRLLAAAAVLAVFTGSSSYRMHAAMQGGVASADDADDRHGWRRWLAGSHSSRRSLRERPLPLLPGQPRLRDPGAQGTQLYEQWWIIGGSQGGGGWSVRLWLLGACLLPD